jgi:hypothetical protein
MSLGHKLYRELGAQHIATRFRTAAVISLLAVIHVNLHLTTEHSYRWSLELICSMIGSFTTYHFRILTVSS